MQMAGFIFPNRRITHGACCILRDAEDQHLSSLPQLKVALSFASARLIFRTVRNRLVMFHLGPFVPPTLPVSQSFNDCGHPQSIERQYSTRIKYCTQHSASQMPRPLCPANASRLLEESAWKSNLASRGGHLCNLTSDGAIRGPRRVIDGARGRHGKNIVGLGRRHCALGSLS